MPWDLGMPADSVDARQIRRLARLPHGNMLTELILGRGDRLSIHFDDLHDYYYLLSWPSALVKYGVLGPLLSVEELGEVGLTAATEPLYACLREPAMGDAKVPDLAQLAHQFLLRKTGSLPDDRWMQYGRPVTSQH